MYCSTEYLSNISAPSCHDHASLTIQLSRKVVDDSSARPARLLDHHVVEKKTGVVGIFDNHQPPSTLCFVEPVQYQFTSVDLRIFTARKLQPVARSRQVCIYWLWKHCLLLSILPGGRANTYRHKKTLSVENLSRANSWSLSSCACPAGSCPAGSLSSWPIPAVVYEPANSNRHAAYSQHPRHQPRAENLIA